MCIVRPDPICVRFVTKTDTVRKERVCVQIREIPFPSYDTNPMVDSLDEDVRHKSYSQHLHTDGDDYYPIHLTHSSMSNRVSPIADTARIAI